LQKGHYRARFALEAPDIEAVLALRSACFRATPDGAPERDPIDEICTHVLIEDVHGGPPVCCFRLLPLAGGQDVSRSYSARYYDLSRLEAFTDPMVEVGRFCVDPARRDPDILRLAWGLLTAYVDRRGARMLFGCASFHGTEAARYREVFALLRDRYLAPGRWLPRSKAPQIVSFMADLAAQKSDFRRAMKAMPPLLRTYLAMGGWVSDHAVVDPDLNTLHVFTGLEVAAIPAARARILRSISS